MMADVIKEIEYELFESQSEIIRLQSEAIIGLVSVMKQHGAVTDEEFAPIKEKIDHAARIRAEAGL